MTAATPATVPDVLDAAADRLVVSGWIQGVASDCEGRLCAFGAIQAVSEFSRDGYELSWTAVDAVMESLGSSLVHWNDRPGQTAGQVIAKLREVAAAERAGGAS